MSEPTLLTSTGLVAPVVKVFSSITSIAALIGKGEANRAIAKQQHIESAILNGDIVFPPGTTIEHMKTAVREEAITALTKSQNRNAVWNAAVKEFSAHLTSEEIKNLPPLRKEIALPLFEYAGECTTKEAQERWAKLIVGECRSTGSVSLKTIHILRTMSNEDALLFEKYAPYILDNIIFMPNEDFFNKNFDMLHEIGLFHEYKNVLLIKINKNETFVSSSPESFFITNNLGYPIEFYAHKLTKVGKEISLIINKGINIEKIKDSFDLIKESKRLPLTDIQKGKISFGRNTNNRIETCKRTKESFLW